MIMGILQNLTGWHALILLAVVLLFFGAAKLPALARSLGQSARILKAESADPAEADAAADAPSNPASPVPSADASLADSR
jgi:sec-independent protein translocase protein TatA